MVRVTAALYRIPSIKFRKGGIAQSAAINPPVGPGGAAPSASAPAATVSKPVQAQPSTSFSTGPAIPDINLPLRYQRQPLSQEEIDHINGGGIV